MGKSSIIFFCFFFRFSNSQFFKATDLNSADNVYVAMFLSNKIFLLKSFIACSINPLRTPSMQIISLRLCFLFQFFLNIFLGKSFFTFRLLTGEISFSVRLWTTHTNQPKFSVCLFQSCVNSFTVNSKQGDFLIGIHFLVIF